MPTKVLLDTDSVQTATNKTFTGPTITAGVVALAAAPVNPLDAATKGYVDGANVTPLLNASLAASIATNILTLHLKTSGGSVPSSTDPVRVTFRSSTDSDGSLVTVTVTSATTMTFSSGSTIGMTSGQAARIWVGLLYSSGSVEICAWNPYNATAQCSLKAFTPNTDVTTTAEGSGTATSTQVLYSANARTSVPFVMLGFIEISEATAGVWATAPTVVQTYREGMRKTGDIIQSFHTPSGAVATGTTIMPSDDTIPQNTEGDQYLSQAIVPTSAINLLKISSLLHFGHSAGGNVFIGLFQDSVAGALAVGGRYIPNADTLGQVLVRHQRLAGTISSATFKIRCGCGTAGTLTINGVGTARLMGGVFESFLSIEEVYI